MYQHTAASTYVIIYSNNLQNCEDESKNNSTLQYLNVECFLVREPSLRISSMFLQLDPNVFSTQFANRPLDPP